MAVSLPYIVYGDQGNCRESGLVFAPLGTK